jgi:hypothetical protein
VTVMEDELSESCPWPGLCVESFDMILAMILVV